MANRYMPISLTVKDHTCLIVGGGAVALRKAEILQDYDMAITVVSPELDPKFEYYGERKFMTVEQRPYKPGEAAEYTIVIAATDDEALNKQIFDECRTSRALVNVVDNPPLCDFIFPAVVRRESLTLSVSTDGTAPFLAGHLRLIMENIFPEHWNTLMRLAADFRNSVQEKYAGDSGKKNVCYERFLEADWKSLLKEKSDDEIDQEIQRMLTL